MSESAALSSPNDACLVCGHPQASAHFDSTTCLACAAFFRRTVSLNISFKCAAREECVVWHEKRMICRSCRMQKCLKVGLKRSLVRKKRLKPPQPKHTTPTNATPTTATPTYDTPTNVTPTEITEITPTSGAYTPSKIDQRISETQSSKIRDQILENSSFDDVQDPCTQPDHLQDTTFLPSSLHTTTSPDSTEHVAEWSNILKFTGPELLDHYVKELRVAMDRRCIMFTDHPMKAIDSSYGDVPWIMNRLKAHSMARQKHSWEYHAGVRCDPIICTFCPTAKCQEQFYCETLVFLKITTMTFCLLDIAWISAQAPLDVELVMYTDGSVSSVRDLSIGWNDEDGINKEQKDSLFFDFVGRLYSGLIRPLKEHKVDNVEYAALKAFCVWKMGYFEYTNNMRALAREHQQALLQGLDGYYEDREDKAERLGNIILLMGTIYEMYTLTLEKMMSIDLFGLCNIDAASREFLKI